MQASRYAEEHHHRRKGGEVQAFLDARPDNRKAGNRLPDKMRITVCANCGGRNCRESLLSKKTKMNETIAFP